MPIHHGCTAHTGPCGGANGVARPPSRKAVRKGPSPRALPTRPNPAHSASLQATPHAVLALAVHQSERTTGVRRARALAQLGDLAKAQLTAEPAPISSGGNLGHRKKVKPRGIGFGKKRPARLYKTLLDRARAGKVARPTVARTPAASHGTTPLTDEQRIAYAVHCSHRGFARQNLPGGQVDIFGKPKLTPKQLSPLTGAIGLANRTLAKYQPVNELEAAKAKIEKKLARLEAK
jgi:hypothetical protein